MPESLVCIADRLARFATVNEFGMDVLTDWLREIESSAVVLCRSRVPAPWGMRISARDGVMFHILTEGACWLRLPEGKAQRLQQGDLLLLPHGLDHDLADDLHTPAEPLDEFLSRPSVAVTGGPVTTLICGVYLSDPHLAHPLLRALPPVVHFPASAVAAKPTLSATLSLLTAELESPSVGGQALVQHLFDALFVYIVRALTEETTDGRGGWLSALADPSLSRALTSLHASPAAPWTVDSLAREAGVSRAVLARRFAEHLGESPLAYLTRWRMALACRLLRDSEASVAEVASRVGYESEFAFSRAFKRTRGLPPTAYRRASPGCSRGQEPA